MPQSLLTFLIILTICAVIAIVAFAFYRLSHPKLKENKPTEEQKEQFLQEELDRVLKPIEDEETAKKVSEYKDDEED